VGQLRSQRYARTVTGVTPDERPTNVGESATKRVRALCMDLPLVVERRSHGEASWFINDKKNFVAMSDHHHDDRVSVTFAASAGVQEALIKDDPVRYFRPPYVGGRGWVGAYLDGHDDSTSPQWERLSDLIVDSWLLVAPPKVRQLLDPQP
jgi:hypothetical protein